MATLDDQLVLLAPAARERRQVMREEVELAATLRGSTIGRTNVVMTDISVLGCQVRAHNHFPIGTYLMVKVPLFEPFGARVVWTEQGQAGLKFMFPLHRAVVDHILALSGHRQRPN